jgi:hypothetical protein
MMTDISTPRNCPASGPPDDRLDAIARAIAETQNRTLSVLASFCMKPANFSATSGTKADLLAG